MFHDSGSKTLGGAGNTFNTFGGKVEAFSPVAKPPAPHEKEPKNFLTRPAKKGTGFGYPGVTIGW